ncbi:MAG: sigma factor-like helix-turn-helix DNA-binding protein [Trichlorobacter sp.]
MSKKQDNQELLESLKELISSRQPQQSNQWGPAARPVECEHTLDEIAQVMGVTRERVRQIEARALWRLRQANRRAILEQFVDP